MSPVLLPSESRRGIPPTRNPTRDPTQDPTRETYPGTHSQSYLISHPGPYLLSYAIFHPGTCPSFQPSFHLRSHGGVVRASHGGAHESNPNLARCPRSADLTISELKIVKVS